ncbi:HyaD/HybD family hydrogenase maturation endopeptidase [Corynebacterium uropygiale]|uniref:HyaD/HybD family hydrogenase maturation endopeptidase n=1 Tax=Corynebacterium uropygiale TaxID=1775911 RepID=A0A9X1QUF0_9CORY|nr:HyaD/HybD family hydrogenase maturation endopeptidase [Corynebacterium uropygiale]MCF4007185.1 HyaD/HybD family hydrogenase maturation endopeptidase [Corynebacterium uropygiale]
MTEPHTPGSGGRRHITVLAVGNPILHDDGTGQAILAALRGQPEDTWMPDAAGRRDGTAREAGVADSLPAGVQCVDGGISGMELLPVLEDATHLLLLDAIAGKEPGEVVVLTGDQLPRLREASLSPHQVGLLDLLSAARLLGAEPEEVAAVGIVPERVDPGVGLSPAVAARVPEAAARAQEILTEWAGDGE